MGTAFPINTVDPDDYAATSGTVEAVVANRIDVVGGRIEYTSSGVLTYSFANNNQIRLYNPSTGKWEIVGCVSGQTFLNSANDLDGNALVSGYNYDLFAQYNTQSGFTFQAKKWTNDTTRAVTPAQFSGVYCYDNSTDSGKSRRWLGTIRMGVSGSTAVFEWNATKTFIANYYNPITTSIYIAESTAHDYDSGAWRAWNGASGDTLLEWISDGFRTPNRFLLVYMRAVVVGAATGDRAQFRIYYNVSYTTGTLVYAYSGWYHYLEPVKPIIERAGYNYMYLQEYGYTDDVSYFASNLQLVIEL